MTRFVLVHGAWWGSQIWERVRPMLEEGGHEVEAPDLPGLGADGTPVHQVSPQDYVDRVCHVLDAKPVPSVLVGYSMGGTVVSQAAEQRPDKVEALIYLAAFLLRDGETPLSVLENDSESLLASAMVMSEDQGYSTLREDAIEETFCADCSSEDVERVKSLAGAQPTAPAITPIAVTDGNFGRVPRTYIETLRDRVISPTSQRRMRDHMPCQRVVSVDTSHMPFLSAPEELTRHLTSLAA